jgi:hypothetical protein
MEASRNGEVSMREVLAGIRESNRWLRVLAQPVLAQALRAALRKPEERRVYQESDGRQVREVSASAGVSYGTVVNYWKRWAKLGLVEETSVQGRFARIVDLEDVGIEVEGSHA